jgi:hypothetical protein
MKNIKFVVKDNRGGGCRIPALPDCYVEISAAVAAKAAYDRRVW